METLSIAGIKIRPLSPEEEREAEDRSRREAIDTRRERLEAHYVSPESGVPRRYHGERLDGLTARTDGERRNIERVRFFISDRNSKTLVLHGANGTGKTLLGCMVIRERGGVYRSIIRLIYELDDTMRYSSKVGKIQLLDGLCGQGMLVIDEVGHPCRAEQQRELLYYILNERYGNGLPTVVISNLSRAELVDFLGSTVLDRLNENGEFLEFTGGSRRIQKRETDAVAF